MAAATKEQPHMTSVQVGETTITGPGIRQMRHDLREIYEDDAEGSDAEPLPAAAHGKAPAARKPMPRSTTAAARRKRTEAARAAALAKRQATANAAKPKVRHAGA